MAEDTYAVMRELIGEYNMRDAASAFVEVMGGAVMDHTRALKERPGVLAQGLDESHARKLVAALRGHGVPAFSMRESEMAIPPPVQEIRDGRIADEGFLMEADSGPVMAPWREMLLMDCSRVRYEVVKRKRRYRTSPDRGGSSESLLPRWLRGTRDPALAPFRDVAGVDPMAIGAHGKPQTEARSAWKEVFDVVCYDPWIHFRMEADAFRYVNANMPVHPTSHLNFTALVVIFNARTEKAVAGPGVAMLLDGNPATRLKSSSLDAFENHVLWRLQLIWRKT